MTAGFGGMLLLIIAIGFIGIQQIQELGGVVAQLAEVEIPMQNAVLEMKSSNIRYAMALRGYVSLQLGSSPDKEAAAKKIGLMRAASTEFDSRLVFYGALASEGRSQEWVKTAQLYENDLRERAQNIIAMAESKERTGEAARRGLEAVNALLMDFEVKLSWLDAFLNEPIRKFNSPQLARQLVWAEVGRRRSVMLLGSALIVCLALGAQTAFLIYRRSKKESAHRDLLWRKVITLEEEERNNLSLQIHDQMGQDLSGLKIFLGLLDKDLLPEQREAREKIEKAKKILDGLMAKTHNISELLRPPELDELGVVESIAGLVSKHKEMTGANCNFLRPAEEVRLPSEESLVLYRLVQEALTNIAKYAQAKNIEIVLAPRAGSVYLAIADDGVGFDTEGMAQRPQRRREDKVKLGLQGLRERIELLGGSLRVTSRPGAGTRLEVILPTT